MNGVTAAIRHSVAEDLAATDVAAMSSDDRKEFARERIFAHLEELAGDRMTNGGAVPSHDEEDQIAQDVLDVLFGLGRLQALVDHPDIENIDVNGCDQVWVTYADGTKERADPVARSDAELIDLVRTAGARFGLSERRFDQAQPQLDLRLPDGSRMSALMAVSRRPAISIRRHRFLDLGLADLIANGSMDEGMASFLRAVVGARKNVVVAGAMNSGKTTLLRALASEIPPRERIVTIEQAFELALDASPGRHPDIVALEARFANLEGEGQITVADLVRRALRMNADRVIVGEVLGDEILPMLNAMSQGRSGSMCTIHSDSSAGVFRRIASYAVQAEERLPLEATNLLIAGAIHFVVFLDSQVPDPGTADRRRPIEPGDSGTLRTFGPGFRFETDDAPLRCISSVREVIDADGGHVVSNEIYRPGADLRAVAGAPLRTETLRDLRRHGFEHATVRPHQVVGGRVAR